MMIKKINILITIISLSSYCHGQQEVISFKINTKSPRSSKTTYTMSNEAANQLAFFIEDRKDIHAHLFDNSFNEISKFTFETPKRRYSEILGYSVNNNVFHLLYANAGIKKFLLVSADFNSKQTTTSELDFRRNGELYIDSVLHNNNLYVLTSDKTSIIIRKLEENATLKTIKVLDMNEGVDDNILYRSKADFWGFYSFNLKESNITKIDHRVPTAIEQASASNKLYKYEDTLVLSLEDNENGTLVYSIDLNSFDIKQSVYDYPKGKIDDFKVYNSFIYDGKIFQIASSRKEMNFCMKSLDGGKMLKEVYLTKEDSITFKNGPIVQEGRTLLPFQNRRELEATSKYLRKISSGDIGIAVIKENNLYEITLGGYKEVQSGSGFAVGFGTQPGFNTSGGVVFTPVFNPTFYNYSTYTNTKATYFDTVLTENFEHVKKDFELSLYQRIDDFMVNYKGVTGEDVFFHNTIPYKAYYDQKAEEFIVVVF